MTHLLLWIIYLSFISLGLPDSLLGAAWPVMHSDLGAPISAAGVISMLISAFVAVSSLCSDRMTRRFGAGKVNAASCEDPKLWPSRCSLRQGRLGAEVGREIEAERQLYGLGQ